jgi:RHS repeat-associated protein
MRLAACANQLSRSSSRYTGKERDTESGNDYFGARYYRSTMGRFMSPDWSAGAVPVPYAKLDNPQGLNLYTYAGNNPLSMIDPDGHNAATDADGKACASAKSTGNYCSSGQPNLGRDQDIKQQQAQQGNMTNSANETVLKGATFASKLKGLFDDIQSLVDLYTSGSEASRELASWQRVRDAAWDASIRDISNPDGAQTEVDRAAYNLGQVGILIYGGEVTKIQTGGIALMFGDPLSSQAIILQHELAAGIASGDISGAFATAQQQYNQAITAWAASTPPQ